MSSSWVVITMCRRRAPARKATASLSEGSREAGHAIQSSKSHDAEDGGERGRPAPLAIPRDCLGIFEAQFIAQHSPRRPSSRIRGYRSMRTADHARAPGELVELFLGGYRTPCRFENEGTVLNKAIHLALRITRGGQRTLPGSTGCRPFLPILSIR